MIVNNGYRYEVINKVIRAWKNSQAEDEAPCLFQDLDPTTSQPFSSDVEATAWIENFIEIANLPTIETPIE